ncbi:MAG: type II and III secretion system protein, partial [Acidobacteria bacterium]|nr:type II and III secretion system protein [Acidobacteriota bacterium]
NPNTAGRINGSRDFAGALTGAAVQLQAGALIGASRELLAFLNLQENATRSKVISAPSLIATDSIAASINVGNEVPTLTSTTASGITTGGNTQFAQNISSRNTGVTLNVMARVNPSGIVTLVINQEVSAPQPPTAGGIPSPSFSKRTVQTQITMQDGDTIAIGGIINESSSSSSSGVPGLHRIPILGAAFGNRSYSRDRTELIVFMTPRVIFDNNDLMDASEELKGRVRKLRKIIKEM